MIQNPRNPTFVIQKSRAMSIEIQKVAQSGLSKVDFNHLPFGKICSDHMFVMDYKDGAWETGKIVPLTDFSIHPANLTLHYGQSIFEGMKASVTADGTPLLFRLDKHIERLNASAERMCMPAVDEDVFYEAIETLVDLEKAWIPPHTSDLTCLRQMSSSEYVHRRHISL